MALYLTHDTALEYWRHQCFRRKTRCRATLPFGLPNADASFKPTIEELDALERTFATILTPPFHLAIPNISSRIRNKRVILHFYSIKLPESSFVPIAPHIYVESPELCLVKMSTVTTFPAFLQLGFEFCGQYRLRFGAEKKMIKADPLTNTHAIEAFVSKIPSIKGVKTARRALGYLCDNSKSPMETDVAIILHLPTRIGGYGLPKPLLNDNTSVTKNMRRILPQSSFALDLYWPDANIGLEYDSRENHGTPSAVIHDAIRNNGIEELGIRVVNMTTAQAFDPIEFERIALIIARQTGKQLRSTTPQIARKRVELRSALFERFKQDSACRFEEKHGQKPGINIEPAQQKGSAHPASAPLRQSARHEYREFSYRTTEISTKKNTDNSQFVTGRRR